MSADRGEKRGHGEVNGEVWDALPSEGEIHKRQVNALALLSAVAQEQDGETQEDEHVFQQFVLQQHLHKELERTAHAESFDIEGQTGAGTEDCSDEELGADKSKARYLRPVKTASSRVGAEFQADIPSLENGPGTR